MKRDEYFKELAKLYPKKYKDRKITTDCSTIDMILGGGFTRGKANGVYGHTNVGKSWLLFQTAAKFCIDHPDQRVLYVDVEANLDEEDIELFQKYFRQRYGLPEDYWFPIFFERKYDLFTLFDYFGMIATIDQKGGKMTTNVQFMREEFEEKKYKDKAGRQRTKKVSKGEHAHVLLSDAYKYIKKNKIGLVIVDSVTQPFKEIFQTSRQQDFPARSNLMNPLLASIRTLAIIEDIPIICALHLTFDKAFAYRSEFNSKPWGGADVTYHLKVIVGMLNATDAEKKLYKDIPGDELRVIDRYRVPGRKRTMEVIQLKEDVGYVDVIKMSGTEGKG